MKTALAILLAAALAGCGETAPSEPAPDRPIDPGSPVDPGPGGSGDELARIQAELDATSDLTVEGLLDRYQPAHRAQLPYQPSDASRLDLIQSSAVGLDSAELGMLDANGFVITERHAFPSFLYGYETLYNEDLPVYVSADAVLHALHSSYDEILKAIELESLIPEMEAMLTEMRGELSDGAAAGLGARAQADVDVYLAVALSLLRDRLEAPVNGGSSTEIRELFEGAQAASGWYRTEIFGVARDVDFSQFTPRGHYTDSPELERYFRAMMWLGRIDFRLVETQPDHSQVFHRRQLEGAFALRAVMSSGAVRSHERVDGTIEAFVGEPDNMTLDELDGLLADLGVQSAEDLANVSDDTIAKTILDQGYGTQRISSHIMINGVGEGTMPLSSTFLLLGQRYVVDSHVFSNVVYDRVQGGDVYRMMPDPLDVAFAALGNDQAAHLLSDELRQYRYAPDLHAMRFLTDAHDDAFWGANLYNRWLTALRALSPTEELTNPAQHGLPELTATEAWGRRLINTQLASWAELRHDTILYAKQSYTGGTSCEYPDAYVDPYPRFYEAIVELAQHGRQVVQNLSLDPSSPLAGSIIAYFDELETVAGRLQEMAEYQRSGTPFTEAQMAFINDAVRVDNGCGSPVAAHGWFARLYFRPAQGAEFDPTIADVHTQPTDEVGNPVGKVLHVGTGRPRLMVVTVQTCSGVNAYAGIVSSYFERTTENFERLTDDQWARDLGLETPADPAWMRDLVAR